MASARRHFTASHWGLYEVENAAGNHPRLKPFSGDPDPSPIGLDQLDENVTRLRVCRPAVRRSWLDGGPGTAPHLRGREAFVEVEWDEALDLVASELNRVRTCYGNAAIFGGSYGWSSAGRFHHAQSQVHRFLNACGGYVRHVDTYSLGAGRVIMPHVVGPIDDVHAEQTSWDVMAEHTQLFVSFGGVPLKNSRVSPGGAVKHGVRAALARMAACGVRFVNISPVHDNLVTGGPVEWIPIRPNTDTALLLALCHEIIVAGRADADFLARCCVGFDRLRDYILGDEDGTPKTSEWAASITGVPAERIAVLAREMSAHRTMINVAWALQRAQHGEQPFWAVVALACLLGQIGLPGGGFGLGYGTMNGIGSAFPKVKGPTLPQGVNDVHDFIPVARVADMLLHPGESFTYNGETYTYPNIKLVYWAGGNPFHHHQDLNRLRDAWEKPQTIIVHEQYWNATARLADIVLPATISAERNDIAFATREALLVAMFQVTVPFAQSRNDYDIFAALAGRLSVENAFTEGLDEWAWLRRLYGAFAANALVPVPDFDAFWEEGCVDLSAHARGVVFLEAFRADPAAHPLPTPSGRIHLFSERVAAAGVTDCFGHPAWFPPTEWVGAPAASEFPLHLISDQPERRLHSQLDHAGYSVDGKVAGREKLTLNEMDALRRGIADGDIVIVWNARGRCLATARVSSDIILGVVRLSTGAWFDPAAEGVEAHGNPNFLTPDIRASGLSQGCSANTCLVEIARWEDEAPRATAHQMPCFEARVVSSASD